MKKFLLYTNLLADRLRRMFARHADAGVTFSNIGEGTFEHGEKSFLAEAATVVTVAALATEKRYLLYYSPGTTGNDYAAICGAGGTPLGVSYDVPETGIPFTVKLFGACKGTVRVQTDGTCTHGNYVKAVAAGQVGLAANGDIVCGIALLDSDATSAANDVIQIIPILAAKHAF